MKKELHCPACRGEITFSEDKIPHWIWEHFNITRHSYTSNFCPLLRKEPGLHTHTHITRAINRLNDFLNTNHASMRFASHQRQRECSASLKSARVQVSQLQKLQAEWRENGWTDNPPPVTNPAHYRLPENAAEDEDFIDIPCRYCRDTLYTQQFKNNTSETFWKICHFCTQKNTRRRKQTLSERAQAAIPDITQHIQEASTKRDDARTQIYASSRSEPYLWSRYNQEHNKVEQLTWIAHRLSLLIKQNE